jgi:hypothetical protein
LTYEEAVARIEHDTAAKLAEFNHEHLLRYAAERVSTVYIVEPATAAEWAGEIMEIVSAEMAA